MKHLKKMNEWSLSDMLDKIVGYDDVLKKFKYEKLGDGNKSWSHRYKCKDGDVIDVRNSEWTHYKSVDSKEEIATGKTPADLDDHLSKYILSEGISESMHEGGYNEIEINSVRYINFISPECKLIKGANDAVKVVGLKPDLLVDFVTVDPPVEEKGKIVEVHPTGVTVDDNSGIEKYCAIRSVDNNGWKQVMLRERD